MPFTVDQLKSDDKRPVTVVITDPVEKALDLMAEHDYSQLPVIDADGSVLGIVTSASILRSVQHLRATVSAIKVGHAKESVAKHFPEDDLFDLLNDLRDAYAVVIVNGEDKLVGIVTSYDTADYFRKRAEDMMYLEDIESALKDYIRSAFTDVNDALNQAALDLAIVGATASDADNRRSFIKGVSRYLELSGVAGQKVTSGNAEKAYNEAYPSKAPKSLDDLSLAEVNQMLLHENVWPHVKDVLDLEKEFVRKLLDSVRDTRNTLFHFRAEVTTKQRDELEYCVGFLNEQRPEGATSSDSERVSTTYAGAPLNKSAGTADFSNFTSTDFGTVMEAHEVKPIEESTASESRYAGLAEHLRKQPETQKDVLLKFDQVEAIIGDPLPVAAWRHRSWWANDSVSHVQSQQWLEAGWKVGRISITDQRVLFTRHAEREKQFIDFFSAVDADLTALAGFPLKQTSPDGANWHTVAALPKGSPQLAIISLSFASRARFRLELYIDTYDERRNKRAFDLLLSDRAEIEREAGMPLVWERLDNRRACRVAVYHPGSITSSPEELDKIRAWIAKSTLPFYNALATRIETALKVAQGEGEGGMGSTSG